MSSSSSSFLQFPAASSLLSAIPSRSCPSCLVSFLLPFLLLFIFCFFIFILFLLSLSYTSSNLHLLPAASFSSGPDPVLHSSFCHLRPMMDTTALLCNICPKKPNFSDVSHLLTHVSSKAHLSHHFKLQVRSHQEPEAGQLLHEYNKWYRANNLARLLSDRMASKEARQKKRQGKAAAQGGTYPAKKNIERKPIPGARPTTYVTSLSGFLDPRLSRPYPKVDPVVDELQQSPFSPSYTTPAISSTVVDDGRRKTCPRPVSPLALESYPEKNMSVPWKTEYDSDSGDDSGSIIRAILPWHGGESGSNARDEIDPRLLRSDLISDPFVETFEIPYDGGGGGHETDRERADEIARLKGVLWPGMDVFDSATEQMRRKRNQKKDENVLKKMEKTSMCVEATELIFSPSGILRKRRVINGNVDDSSPLKGETPIPKRRPVRPKRLLFSQKDPNIGPRRGPERKRAKKFGNSGTKKPQEETSRRGLRAIRDATNQLPVYFRGGYDSSSFGEVDDELDLTIKGFDQKTRSGFTVFQDDQDQCDLNTKDHFQEDKPPFGLSSTSLTSFPRRETMACGPFQSSFMAGSSSCASNFTGKPSCHSTKKENIEPILNIQGPRIEHDTSRPPFTNKFNYSSDTAYPPHYFFGDVPHATFGPFDDHELSGCSLNPLAISLPRLPVQDKENHIYNTDIKPNYDRQPVTPTRPASPDGTISDVEQDDFERLYLDGSSY